jgi:hypothetical protein
METSSSDEVIQDTLKGYWIPTLSIKTEMHLGVDAYDMVQS